MKFIKAVKKKDLMNAYCTIGVDENSALTLRIKENPYPNIPAAIFNKKQFRYKRPVLAWEQTYKKVNI